MFPSLYLLDTLLIFMKHLSTYFINLNLLEIVYYLMIYSELSCKTAINIYIYMFTLEQNYVLKIKNILFYGPKAYEIFYTMC
jgi:hypothetical protein